MANGLCKDTALLNNAEARKIKDKIGNELSLIKCKADYDRIITYWREEKEFVDKMFEKRKVHLESLKEDLFKLLKFSFPKEKININTVTELQRSFSPAKPFSINAPEYEYFTTEINSITSGIQRIISDAEQLETLVSERLNLCNQVISKIDKLIGFVDGAEDRVNCEVEYVRSSYEELKSLAPYMMEDFWTWLERSNVQVNVEYYFSWEFLSV